MIGAPLAWNISQQNQSQNVAANSQIAQVSTTVVDTSSTNNTNIIASTWTATPVLPTVYVSPTPTPNPTNTPTPFSIYTFTPTIPPTLDTSKYPTLTPMATMIMPIAIPPISQAAFNFRNSEYIGNPGLDKEEGKEIAYYQYYIDRESTWLKYAPTDTNSYRKRAKYYLEAAQYHDAATASTYYDLALKDINKAIEIGPPRGYFYSERSVLWLLTAEGDTHIERVETAYLVIEDISRATYLRNGHENKADMIVKAYYLAAECQTGLQYLDQVQEKQRGDVKVLGGMWLRERYIDFYICIGDYEQAIDMIVEIAEQTGFIDCNLDQLGLALFNKGELEDAAAAWTEVIDIACKNNTIKGEHYFIRAAILYETGAIDAAMQDIDAGKAITADRGELYAYVMGNIAIDNGNINEGVELLIRAEVTLNRAKFPRIYQDIVGLIQEHQPEFTPTEYTGAPPYVPIWSYKTTGSSGYGSSVSFQGTGFIMPRQAYRFEFLSSEPYEIVQPVKIVLIFNGEIFDPSFFLEEFQFKIWIPEEVGNTSFPYDKFTFDNINGHYELPTPEKYITPNGIFEISFATHGVKNRNEFIFSNIQVIVEGYTADGEYVIYGR